MMPLNQSNNQKLAATEAEIKLAERHGLNRQAINRLGKDKQRQWEMGVTLLAVASLGKEGVAHLNQLQKKEGVALTKAIIEMIKKKQDSELKKKLSKLREQVWSSFYEDLVGMVAEPKRKQFAEELMKQD